jgi:hypothetical protein
MNTHLNYQSTDVSPDHQKQLDTNHITTEEYHTPDQNYKNTYYFQNNQDEDCSNFDLKTQQQNEFDGQNQQEHNTDFNNNAQLNDQSEHDHS